MRRIVLVRHGETTGNSAERYHGSSDLPLSPEGREQMGRVATEVGRQELDVIAASPLRRAWQSAAILAPGRTVRLLDELKEIHFGRWEGKTREEIEASDPVLFADWQKGADGFEFPGGEPRADFRARVERGLGMLAAGGGRSALVVTHRGVIRTALEFLTGEKPEQGMPALGAVVELTARPDGTWYVGRRSSNPEGLDEDAA